MVPADSRRIPRVPRYSGYRYVAISFAYWTFTICGSSFQKILLTACIQCRGPTTPQLRCHSHGLGSSPFARHYWGNHCLFSFPAGTKMFQFPALAPTPSVGDRPSDGRVVPFGNLRIKGYLHLPEAYRSLSRPSSPL